MVKKNIVKDEPNVRPLGDRVLISLVEKDSSKVTSSGIIIPDTNDKSEVENGIVVAVGEGRMSEKGERVKMTVAVGERVLFTRFSAEKVNINNKDYYIVREDQIIGLIE